MLRLAAYLAIGFLVRSALLLVVGGGGLREYRELSAYRDELRRNVAELQQLNRRLLQEQSSLASDPERIALQARQLGYFREGDRVVRLQGIQPPRDSYVVGRLLRRPLPAERRDQWAKLLGLLIPIGLYCFSVLRRARNAHRRG